MPVPMKPSQVKLCWKGSARTGLGLSSGCWRRDVALRRLRRARSNGWSPSQTRSDGCLCVSKQERNQNVLVGGGRGGGQRERRGGG